MNLIILGLSKFRTKVLATNHLIIRETNKFDTEWKSLKFLLESITLVSSANNIYSHAEFILRELILGELYVAACPSQRKKG
jgi:hypothetical protein